MVNIINKIAISVVNARNSGQNMPQNTENGPKTTPNDAKTTQNGPKSVQNRPKTPENAPKTPQKRRKWEILDLYSPSISAPEALFSTDGHHFSAAGNAFFARFLAALLEN
jgi:lysophospholipase L1-like esterase